MAEDSIHVDVLKDIQTAMKKRSGLDVKMIGQTGNVEKWISTGCKVLDYIMGGGVPVGRIVEFYGEESTGKSLVAAQVVKAAQDAGYLAVMADSESAFSQPIAEAVGVDFDKLIYSEPETIEDALEFFDAAIEAKMKNAEDIPMLLVWDSIAATSTKSELEGDFGASTMAIHARLISQGLRKLNTKIKKTNCACFFINQTREKIGVMFGEKKSTFGGNAMKFYSSIRIQLYTSGKIKDGKSVIGITTNAVVKKNKVAPPFKQAKLPIYFGHGVDDAAATFEFLKDHGLIDRSGSKYRFKDTDEPVFMRTTFHEIYEEYEDTIDALIHGEELEFYEEVEDDEEVEESED